MKRPKTLTTSTNFELSGVGNSDQWIQNRNCVYRDLSTNKFRVSIKTLNGWETYGYFSDLEVASYVANIAILNEECENEYQLNSVGEKDKHELNSWRKSKKNHLRENNARNKFKVLQEKIKQDHEIELARKEKRIREIQTGNAEREQLKQVKNAQELDFISKAPKATLLDMLESDIGGELHRKITSELKRRLRQFTS